MVRMFALRVYERIEEDETEVRFGGWYVVEQDFPYGVYGPRQMRLSHIRTHPDHFVPACRHFVDLFRLDFFQRMTSPHPTGSPSHRQDGIRRGQLSSRQLDFGADGASSHQLASPFDMVSSQEVVSPLEFASLSILLPSAPMLSD